MGERIDQNNKQCFYFIFDDAEKSPMSHIVLMCSKQYLHNKKREDLTESTGVVPAKYPPKVKLELFTTLECQNCDQLCVPVFLGSLGFYNSVQPNSFACITSLFLIGQIFINVRIFQNPPHVRISFILGLYGLGLIVRRKLFLFRVSWRSHYDQLSATWLFGPSTLCSFTWDPSTISSSIKQSVHLSESITFNFLPLQYPSPPPPKKKGRKKRRIH